MEAHIFNLSTQEAEAGGLCVQGQPELYGKTLSQPSAPQEKKKENRQP
jgi:hypothetical protein